MTPIHSPLVSIIIPVYNAEKTLHRTLNTIMRQTYANLELVVVNDCSTDRSAVLLTKYMSVLKSMNIAVSHLEHAVNRGVAAARNTALENAKGTYIYYVDADDTLESNAIELLVSEALRADADIVGCNWYLTFEKKERKMNQPDFRTAWEAIEKLLKGGMRWNLWLFLVKRSLYEDHQIRFIDGKNIGEDLLMTIKLLSKANVVSFVNQALYHYEQSNEGSLTKLSSANHISDITLHVQEAEACLYNSPYKDIPNLPELIRYLKLHIKLPLLISSGKSDYILWRNWFSEVNAYAMVNKSLSLRKRLLQGAAAQGQFWFIRLHYFIVIRFVYGVLYR